MLLIKQLVEHMKDEVEDIKCYSIMALRYKASKPALAATFHEIATDEMKHFNELHTHALNIVEEVKNSGTTIPSDMMTKFEKYHECLIEKQAEAQTFLDLYDKQ